MKFQKTGIKFLCNIALKNKKQNEATTRLYSSGSQNCTQRGY